MMTEKEAIIKACEIGKVYGYGNVIAHLGSAWALMLMQDYGFKEKDALDAACGVGYPIELHQEFIKDNS